MKKYNYILFFILGLFSNSIYSNVSILKPQENFELVTTKQQFNAGEFITLRFSSTIKSSPILIIKNSYGSTVLSAKNKNNLHEFIIPTIFSKKSGILNWTLINNKKVALKNFIEIIPNTATKNLVETYLGPRSIQAGYRDYSMLVVIPTDKFDNPLPNNSLVNTNVQFLNNIQSNQLKTNNLIAWENISSKEKSGAIHISSTSNSTNTKELTTVIYPSNPTNFLIHYRQNHNFADGNQITTLITSTIKDEFENIITDGTLVEFHILNTNNTILKTRASTINGIATAKMLHPDHKDIWNVKATINGFAESNLIHISFKQIVSSFNISFSKNNRTITVGPIVSFMNQLIPDGALVKLNIYHKNKLVETKSITSSKGYAEFYLSEEFYIQKSYYFEVNTLGISKKIEEKMYE